MARRYEWKGEADDLTLHVYGLKLEGWRVHKYGGEWHAQAGEGWSMSTSMSSVSQGRALSWLISKFEDELGHSWGLVYIQHLEELVEALGGEKCIRCQGA